MIPGTIGGATGYAAYAEAPTCEVGYVITSVVHLS